MSYEVRIGKLRCLVLRFSTIVLAVAMAFGVCLPSGLDTAEVKHGLSLDRNAGVVWRSPLGVVWLDGDEGNQGPILSFLPGGPQRLGDAVRKQISASQIQLSYHVAAPGNATVEIVRDVRIQGPSPDLAVVETFTLRPSQPLAIDVQIERPFSIQSARPNTAIEVVCPLKNGWAKATPLGDQRVQAEYRLGNFLGTAQAELALPLVQVGNPSQWKAGLISDPAFSSLFDVRRKGDLVQGSVSYRYLGSRVPICGEETRHFAIWLSPVKTVNEPFGDAVDAFFQLMLPDVPPGPQWLHEIAMVHYDYLSDKGLGWDLDVALLAQWLEPEERRRVALCLHGWYDAIGSYCYDASTGRLREQWLGFGPTQKIPLTQDEIRRRLRSARQLGFRVLLYFADGMTADSGAPGFRDDWVYRDAQGKPIRGWQGPDTFGPTFWLNPAHPEVFAWFLGYMDALLKTYGPDVDGFVWDETFQARLGQIAMQPEPAYCDRAMLSLVKELSHRVHQMDSQKVFLASDCIGAIKDVPGYAMVSHGTYQDTGCSPTAWSYGLFPNWRNVLWSCNWRPITNFDDMRWGVETFGVPVAISNGWGDDRGASEWTTEQREAFLGLFRKRLTRRDRVRYLSEDPHKLLARTLHPPAPGDPLPVPTPGSVNWASAARGARATASSEEAPRFPASGAIDGVRDDTGWGSGHGWASAAGAALPQWLQVDFPQPRTVNQFIVITYQRETSTETATKWGIQNYEVQAWDAESGQWKTLVQETQNRAVKVRVHTLPQPIRTQKVRLLVTRVAPSDQRARVLQLEVWGPENP